MSSLSEVGKRGASEFHRGEKVDLHDPPQALLLCLVKRTNRADSRIVNQAVKPAEIFLTKLQGG
jgi:hypothetical protein